MKIKSLLTIMGLLTLPMFGAAYAGGGSGWSSITQMYVYNSGVIRVYVSPAHQDPDGCGTTGHVYIPASADKNMYSTALTAFTAGKEVSFYMSGCLTESGFSAPQITRLAIR